MRKEIAKGKTQGVVSFKVREKEKDHEGNSRNIQEQEGKPGEHILQWKPMGERRASLVPNMERDLVRKKVNKHHLTNVRPWVIGSLLCGLVTIIKLNNKCKNISDYCSKYVYSSFSYIFPFFSKVI